MAQADKNHRIDSEHDGYAIWLVPDDSDQPQWSKLIERCSRFFGVSPHVPHVTLLARLGDDTDNHLRLFEKLASNLNRIELSFLGIGFRVEFFQAFFAIVESSAEVQSARERAIQTFGVKERPFAPHLSLAYGHLDETQQREYKQVLEPDMPPSSVMSKLVLMRLKGTHMQWTQLAEQQLG